jgi:hypothetical protein
MIGSGCAPPRLARSGGARIMRYGPVRAPAAPTPHDPSLMQGHDQSGHGRNGCCETGEHAWKRGPPTLGLPGQVRIHSHFQSMPQTCKIRGLKRKARRGFYNMGRLRDSREIGSETDACSRTFRRVPRLFPAGPGADLKGKVVCASLSRTRSLTLRPRGDKLCRRVSGSSWP